MASRIVSAGDVHIFTAHGPRFDAQIVAEPMDDFGGQGMTFPRQVTGANDDSSVLDLPPGQYWLRVRPFHGYVASASMGGADLLHEPLVVVAGGGHANRDHDARRYRGTSGSLLGVAATTVDASRSGTQSYIYCFPLTDNPGRLLELSVSSDGKFDVQGVTPRGLSRDRVQQATAGYSLS